MLFKRFHIISGKFLRSHADVRFPFIQLSFKISNLLFYPVYRISFQLDWVSILICLTIAFLGTAFAFFLSMKAVSLVSPLVVSVVSASEPLSSAILSVLFLGLVLDGYLLLAMILIIIPMIFLSIEESKDKLKESSFNT